MPKQHEFSIGCITGKGRTKAEAKHNAITLADSALSQEYTLHTVTLRGLQAIIFSTPQGFNWKVISSNTSETFAGKVLGCTYIRGREATLKEVYGEILTHFAQQTFDFTDMSCPFSAEEFPHEAKDYASWCDWQMRHKALKESGLFDANACHYLASGHVREFLENEDQKAFYESMEK